MRLSRLSGPPERVVTLEQAKAHLRVDGDDEDAQIGLMIDAATSHLDGYNGTLGRCLVSQDFRASLDLGEVWREPFPDMTGLVFDMDARTVDFTAGYGTPDDVPASIRQAILLHIGTLYEVRETAAEKFVPTGVYEALLAPHRMIRP